MGAHSLHAEAQVFPEWKCLEITYQRFHLEIDILKEVSYGMDFFYVLFPNIKKTLKLLKVKLLVFHIFTIFF
jgi:hypothetical protein